MKFDTPASTNPIDQMNVIGQPKDRVEGKLKTTGTATYAYEQQAAASHPAYGYVVGSSIAKGRISSIDSSEARQAKPAALSQLSPLRMQVNWTGASFMLIAHLPALRLITTTRQSQSSWLRRSNTHIWTTITRAIKWY